MAYILFSQVSCPFILIQNRTLVEASFQFMIFILLAGISSGKIYYFSEG